VAYSYAVNRSGFGFALIAVVAACTPKENQSTDDDVRRYEQQREVLKKLTQMAVPLTSAVPVPEPALVAEPPLEPADRPVHTGAVPPIRPLPTVALRPFAQLVPTKPGPFGRAAMLRPKMSIAQVTAQLRDVSDEPAAVFARLHGAASCAQDTSATYDRFARMNSDGAGLAMIFESEADPTSLREYSIVVPTDATDLLTQKWGPPSEDGLWFDATGTWQISTSTMSCVDTFDVHLPTIRFAVRPLTRAQLLGREILQWFGRPLTAQLSTVEIERTPTVTDTAEATEQMDGSFEIDAADGAVMGTISTDASNKVVAVELTFATSERSSQRLMMQDLSRLWGKPTVEVTDDGDIGVVFHKSGFKIYGADTGNQSWIFSISR
jgi:hypothetical protein